VSHLNKGIDSASKTDTVMIPRDENFESFLWLPKNENGFKYADCRPFCFQLIITINFDEGFPLVVAAVKRQKWPAIDPCVRYFCCWFSPSSEGFSPGSPVFLPPQKSTFPNSNSIGNSRATGLSVEDCYVLPSLNKVIYLFMLAVGVTPF